MSKTQATKRPEPSGEPAGRWQRREHRGRKPVLRFTAYAWSRLLFCRDLHDREVGGFGICATDDLLLVTDFALVKQEVTV